MRRRADRAQRVEAADRQELRDHRAETHDANQHAGLRGAAAHPEWMAPPPADYVAGGRRRRGRCAEAAAAAPVRRTPRHRRREETGEPRVVDLDVGLLLQALQERLNQRRSPAAAQHLGDLAASRLRASPSEPDCVASTLDDVIAERRFHRRADLRRSVREKRTPRMPARSGRGGNSPSSPPLSLLPGSIEYCLAKVGELLARL